MIGLEAALGFLWALTVASWGMALVFWVLAWCSSEHDATIWRLFD